VGKVGGIELRIDASWVLIFLLLTWSLGAMFGSWHPQWGFGQSLALGGAAALLFFASVLLHEVAHCLVAIAYGIPVRDITLHLFGGLASIEEDPPSPKAEFWMAIVGPAVSLAVAFVASTAGTALFMVHSGNGVSFGSADMYGQFGPLTTLLFWLGTANFVVALFNLLPGLPLDGGRVLRATLWAVTGNVRSATRWAAMAGQLIGWLLVFAGILMAFGSHVPLLGRGFGAGLWTALIGWFLRGAAAQTFQQAILQDILEGVRASSLMRRDGPWISSDLTVKDVVDDVFLRRDDGAYPVFDHSGAFVGLLTLDDVRKVPEAARLTTPVGAAMTPLERLPTASPDMPVFDALRKMRRAGLAELPVHDGRRLVGMLFDTDIGRWIELHQTGATPGGIVRAAR